MGDDDRSALHRREVGDSLRDVGQRHERLADVSAPGGEEEKDRECYRSIDFGAPQGLAGLSPGRQAEACPTWDKLQLVQASQTRPIANCDADSSHQTSVAGRVHHSEYGVSSRLFLSDALCTSQMPGSSWLTLWVASSSTVRHSVE